MKPYTTISLYVLAIVLIALLAIYTFLLTSVARMVPLTVVFAIFLLLVIQMATHFLISTKTDSTGSASKPSEGRSTVWIWILLMPCGVWLFGIVVATFLFNSVYLRFVGHVRFYKTVILSALVSVVLHLLFHYWLEKPLYRGFLFQWLEV